MWYTENQRMLAFTLYGWKWSNGEKQIIIKAVIVQSLQTAFIHLKIDAHRWHLLNTWYSMQTFRQDLERLERENKMESML